MAHRRKRSRRCRGCGMMFGTSKHFFVDCEAERHARYARRRGLVHIHGNPGVAALQAGHAHIYFSSVLLQGLAITQPGEQKLVPVRTAPDVWTYPWVTRLYDHLRSTRSYQGAYDRFVELLRDPIERERELAMLSLRGSE